LVEALRYKPEHHVFDSPWVSTQTLTEMSTRDVSWGQRQAVRKADNLDTFMCRLSRNSGSLDLLKASGTVQRLLYPVL